MIGTKVLWHKESEFLYRLYDESDKHLGSIYRATPLPEAARWNAYVVQPDGSLRNVGAYSDGFEARLVVEAATREPKQPEPRVNEASLFDALKDIAKDICDFAYENKPHAGYFFDVVAKDGGVFRVNVSMLRHDAFPGPPIVVLEPKSKETVVYGTRPDGSYRSPGCWDDAMEADYQALMRRVADHTLPASETASEAFVETYNDPEKGRERFMNSRDDLIADGWVKVK